MADPNVTRSGVPCPLARTSRAPVRMSARTSRAPVQTLEVARTSRAPVQPPISVRLVMGFARTSRAPTQTPSVKVSPGRSSNFRPTLSRGINLLQNEPPETRVDPNDACSGVHYRPNLAGSGACNCPNLAGSGATPYLRQLVKGFARTSRAPKQTPSVKVSLTLYFIRPQLADRAVALQPTRP